MAKRREVRLSVSAAPGVRFTWKDINVEIAKAKHRKWEKVKSYRKKNIHIRSELSRRFILSNVTGEVRPGELLAILGASGAGKTTLLNVLTMRRQRGLEVSGSIFVNGQPVDVSFLSSISAYVQQDDLFLGTLTVREQLVFNALLRMSRDIPYNRKIRRVNQLLHELGLTKCQDTLIGIPGRIKGISGGEKRRLAFACEILNNPPLMFCDEPTSGLDSFMARSLVSAMQKLARKGKTVLCTIHQPSSEIYEMFDKLLLMAEGRVAFIGKKDEALDFFNGLSIVCPENYNPADFFIQTLAVDPGREMEQRAFIWNVCDAFQDSPYGRQMKNEINKGFILNEKMMKDNGIYNIRAGYKANCFQQFQVIMWRSFLCVMREPTLFKLRSFQTILASVLFLIVFWQQELQQSNIANINGFMFLVLIGCTYQFLLASTTVFSEEMPVFLREHANMMYKTSVYFFSKTTADLPVFIIMPIIMVVLTYWAVGLYGNFERFLACCLIVMYSTNAAVSFGYWMAAMGGSTDATLAIAAPLVLPFLLFGGFFLNKSTLPSYLRWFQWVSWFRYAFEALCINQWVYVDKIKCDVNPLTCPSDGQLVLQILDFDASLYSRDMLLTMVLIVSFRVLGLISLIIRAKLT